MIHLRVYIVAVPLLSVGEETSPCCSLALRHSDTQPCGQGLIVTQIYVDSAGIVLWFLCNEKELCGVWLYKHSREVLLFQFPSGAIRKAWTKNQR